MSLVSLELSEAFSILDGVAFVDFPLQCFRRVLGGGQGAWYGNCVLNGCLMTSTCCGNYFRFADWFQSKRKVRESGHLHLRLCLRRREVRTPSFRS